MSNQLALTNVVTVSVSQANVGVGSYNTSNLAIFTYDTPGGSFTGDYAFYVTPTEVGVDFGTNSDTYKMALAIFSQQPNILAGGGQLIVIPLEATDTTEIQHIAFSIVPTAGAWKITHNGNQTGSLAFGANAATVQIALRLLAGLASVTVAGDYTTGFNITFTGVTGNTPQVTISANSLQGAASEDVIVTPSTTTPGSTEESLAEAIARTSDLVQYFGILISEVLSSGLTEADMDAAAAVIQTLNKMAFFVSRTAADFASGGALDDLATADLTQSRGLYYGADNDADALSMVAAYAGRALSTNFLGSNTTQTMHLKTLTGIEPDPTITQTQLTACIAAGVDTYISLQGSSAVFTANANGGFFDQIYNLRWLVGALQVAGYNYLAQAGTKVPQTESGMDGLKGAYRAICQQAVTNGYSAPGSWNSPTTFGNQGDLLSNVSQIGYYIYSLPVAQQLQAARVARTAPLAQIALKEAGAIQSSSVIVTVNA